MKRTAAYMMLTVALLVGTAIAQPQSGDLLFVRGGRSGMEEAISAATGQYTHVAILEVDSAGQQWVIEATTGHGVRRIHYAEWAAALPQQRVDAYRLTIQFDTAAALARAKAMLGLPYDDAFLPDNDALYCSELVYECYLDADGRHLFEARPMNFRNRRGRLPRYWRRHFRRLGIPVPEGVPGTNPTDLSRSPLLRRY